MKKNKELISNLLMMAVTVFMVLLSDKLNEKEIIFPEIAALTIGALAAPKLSWQVSKVKMVILIALCSCFGLFMSMYVSIPMAIKITIAYVVCQILMYVSYTTFAPMISAAILPILMNTKSIIYPISAIGFTALIVLIRSGLEKKSIKEIKPYVPYDVTKRDWIDVVSRSVVVFIIAFISIKLGYKFCVAPPLIVAFTELSRKDNKLMKKPLKPLLIIFLCSLSGAMLRYSFCTMLGLSKTIVSIAIVVVILGVIKLTGVYMPPSGALGLLPLIIPEDQLLYYPIEILVSLVIMIGFSLLYNKIKNRISSQDN